MSRRVSFNLRDTFVTTMAQIKETSILDVLLQAGIDPSAAQKIIQAAKEKDLAEKEPAVPSKKKEFLVIVNDPAQKLPKDLTCWVIQKEDTYIDTTGVIPTMGTVRREWGSLESEELLMYLARATMDNERLVKKKGPITCVGDVFEFALTAKAKECGFCIKTKQPVAIIGVNPNIQWMETIEEENERLGVKTADKPE